MSLSKSEILTTLFNELHSGITGKKTLHLHRRSSLPAVYRFSCPAVAVHFCTTGRKELGHQRQRIVEQVLYLVESFAAWGWWQCEAHLASLWASLTIKKKGGLKWKLHLYDKNDMQPAWWFTWFINVQHLDLHPVAEHTFIVLVIHSAHIELSLLSSDGQIS